VNKLGATVIRELRKIVPATLFFLLLFHLIALTKAVILEEYSVTALRLTATTFGALVVAKAILVVEALPIAKLFSHRRAVHVLWQTLLFAAVAALFRFVEELVPLISKHGDLLLAATAMYEEISWPLFGVFALWILGGLLLYCFASELIRAVGAEKVREIFFGTRSTGSGGRPRWLLHSRSASVDVPRQPNRPI
jgi:hypothetical protein